ncbi:nucleolar complex protein 3 homolog [Argiope bruennichi]|uniref:nucleolar complex protein 3 homolog n=1 Tax=Argiope bruennichi TaxID=94029 RepID=UPI0024958947|nr:nucleolar complex protein 3 homolog [Argiope bruennichi]
MSVKKRVLTKEKKHNKSKKSKVSKKGSNSSDYVKKRSKNLAFNKSQKKHAVFKEQNYEKPTAEPASESEEDNEMSVASSDDSEEEYEKAPRIKKSVQVRNLLPIKNKKGLIYRSEIVKEESEDELPAIDSEKKEVKKKDLIQSYAMQQKVFKDLKRKVALLCTSIIEEPDNNMVALKELVSMIQNQTTQMVISEKKVLCLSLLHVFLDVLPGYRIRTQEETDTKVKLKKETRKLLGYEQTLLKCYKKYLDLLYDLVRDMKHKMSLNNISSTKQRVSYEVGLIAVRCLCELLSTRFSFNYFKNIANKLVPVAIDYDENISNMCCKAFEKLFRADKLGEASFSLVKQIIDVIKERKFNVPVCLLRTFLCLNLREARPEFEKVDMAKGRKEWRAMSRSQRKDKKKIKDLEAELKEAQAYECVDNVKKFHTATLNKIFWVFFHILKDGEKVSLIGPALEGLSKFAYLINLEFFDDLNAVVCGMMESGKLSDVDKLHGVYTLFTILAGQAESLHIDPLKIYCHMYQGLLNLSHSTDVEHFDLTLKCLEFNILRKKKKISFNRILAFIKRVCSVSLQTPVHGTLGLLCSVRNIMMNVKGADILLDSENSIGSGIFHPEMGDPEHCNAQSTALWELHLLKTHYHPAIKLYAQHLLHNCSNTGRSLLPDKLAKLTPIETLNRFSEIAVENRMDFLENTEEPPKKKFKIDNSIENTFVANDVKLELDADALHNIDFLQHVASETSQ